MNLQKIIHSWENEHIEFKEKFSDKVIETLVSFANFRGWKIFVWVKDNWDIIWIQIWKETIQNYINKIKLVTEYKIITDYEVVEFKWKTILIFKITEHPNKPISIKWKYYKRRLNSNHLMSTDEITDEYLKTKNLSYDMHFVDWKTIADLDFDKILETIDKINENRLIKIEKDVLSFLHKFELNYWEKITHAAHLLFPKKAPQESEILIWLFWDDITIKKSETIKASLIDEVEMVMDFVLAYITKEYIITWKPARYEKWQYPIEAIREFVINAIIHRKYIWWTHSQFRVYRHKLQFWNYWKLDPELTIEKLYSWTEKSYTKNKKISEIFKELWLIEKYWSWINRSVKKVENYWLPKPKIEEVSWWLQVEIYDESFLNKKEEKNEGVNEGVNELLDFIKNNPWKRTFYISKKINKPQKTIERWIKKLKDEWKIEFRWASKTWGYFIK